jgi:MSHA biogenesis protein MshL
MVLGAAGLLAQAPAARPGQLPILPLTQLDERALAADLDNKAFTLTFAQPVPIRDLLLLLVRGTTLSMIPDPEIAGSFIGELKNVSVRQALGLILPPVGLDYSVDGAFIRVFRRTAETRVFELNYAATERTGSGVIGGGPGNNDPASGVRVSTAIHADVFSDIEKGVQTLLSEHGTFNVDRKAGLLQVTDFPERLDRVANYLDAVSDRVHRQVEIDARVLEVELKDPNAQSLDLAALTVGVVPGTGAAASRQMVSGLGPGEVTRFLAALAEQGVVSLLANPRILALNNEPAVVRGTMHGGTAGVDDEEGVTLAVTPQISSEGAIMLSLSPIVSLRAADAKDKAPAVMAIRETDTLARVADGATIVLAGFTRERETRERQAAGIKGGWFGRSTVVTKKRIELVIMLTPRIVSSGEAQ